MKFALVRLTLACSLFTAASLSQAAGFGSNLIVNGDAESGLAGWQSFAGVDLFSSENYGSNWVLPTQPGPADRGTNLFVGGSGVSYAAGYQDLDLGAFAPAQLAAGSLGYTVSGWLGGWTNQTDNAQFTVRFFDSGSNLLGSATLGPVTPADRGNTTGLFYFTASGSVPAGTSAMQAILEATRFSGGDNDGYADNLSFTVTSAVPESQTAALMLAGLGALSLLRLRRQVR